MVLYLWIACGLFILLMVTGAIIPGYVRKPSPSPEPELNPYLKPRELPFDRNLAAVGVLEPEFVEVPDLEAWRVKVQEIEAANSADVQTWYEPILEMGSELPVAYLGQAATPEYIEPPTKTELRWKNTLAEQPAYRGKNYEFRVPQPGRPTMCLLDHKHTTKCAPIPRGESEWCW